MLQVRSVSKRYVPATGPVDALVDVDLTVAKGSFTAVLGSSGSGKTTLLRVIAGFEVPDHGVVELDGRILTDGSTIVPPEQRNVGIVAQDGALFPHLNVHDNIAYGLRARRTSGRWRRRFAKPDARVEELLELVGLAGYGDRSPNQLSGGQQQRVALARALAPGPGLLLMDEPFSALDAGLRSSLREEVRDLLGSLNTTVVLVTHDQNEALSMADHVVIMRSGRVIQAGTPDELYRHPVDRATAEFLGTAVVLPAKVLSPSGAADGRVRAECVLGVVPVDGSAGDPAGAGDAVVIRPEQLVLSGDGVPGTVTAVNYYGHDGTARIILDGCPNEVVVRLTGSALPAVGERVGVALSPGVTAQLL